MILLRVEKKVMSFSIRHVFLWKIILYWRYFYIDGSDFSVKIYNMYNGKNPDNSKKNHLCNSTNTARLECREIEREGEREQV